MCGGGVLAYMFLIPLIKHFGAAYPNIFPPGTVPLSEMGPSQIRGAYVLYIARARNGGWDHQPPSLHADHLEWHEARHARPAWNKNKLAAETKVNRVDDDLPISSCFGGIIALIAMIMLSPSLNLFLNPIGAILIVFGSDSSS